MVESPILSNIFDDSERHVRSQGLIDRADDSLALFGRPCRHDHQEAVDIIESVSKQQSCLQLCMYGVSEAVVQITRSKGVPMREKRIENVRRNEATPA